MTEAQQHVIAGSAMGIAIILLAGWFLIQMVNQLRGQ
jgi:hypothetical protein